MILQALKDYYDRKAADPESCIAPLGWEWKEIPFVFVIAENGKFLQIEDTREVVGKKKRAKPFRVPQSVVRTRNPAAFTLWDKAEYAFPGIAKGTDADKKHVLFLDCLDKYSGELPSVLSVRRFLTEHFDERELRGNDIWNEYVQSGGSNSPLGGSMEPSSIPTNAMIPAPITPTPEQLQKAFREYLEAQLLRSPDVNPLSPVQVSYQNGVVTVRGVVPTPSARAAAGYILLSDPRVSKVNNLMTCAHDDVLSNGITQSTPSQTVSNSNGVSVDSSPK